MSKVFFWIVVMPLAAAVIVFSVNNRADVVLDLWPLDMVTQPLPVFSVVLAGLFSGFLIGGLVAWISGAKARRRARREGQRADRAERELKDAEARLERQQSETETTEPGEDAPRLSSLPPDAAARGR
ncbi:MAG: LapA family protein [Proteobacteria bacterium]|nr:LapA family protein [Pseudomonadota bacterium]